MEKDHSPEAPSHLRAANELIISYAKGDIDFAECNNRLNAWWETHKEAWQENDLHRLFLLVCLSN